MKLTNVSSYRDGMNFFYDITEILVWKGEYTGIQRVVHGYSEGFKAQKPDTTFFYIKNGIGYSHKTGEPINLNKRDVIFTTGANWDRMENLSFFENAKLSGVYCVNLYHDLTPIVIPHAFKPGFCGRFITWFKKTSKYFDYHLTISEHSKKDLIRYSPYLNEDNVKVVRSADQIHSISLFNSIEQEDYLSSYNLKEYILSVGTIEFRKNHITLINAYRLLIKEGHQDIPKLVIVGRFGWMNFDLKYQVDNDPNLKEKVVFINSATDSQLDCLYRNCLFSLYASIYEGWGLPIAESLNYGKPCIISNNTSLPEIAPDLTYIARTLDPYDWAEKISDLYYNTDLYSENIKDIDKKFKSTNWNESSKQVLFLIQEWHRKIQRNSL